MKFCVIGLGRFGYQVATVLAENGMEVLAVDSNETIVTSISDKVTQAVCMRIADEESLRSINAEEMDTVIVAMGENFDQSILVTALLKKRLSIRNVVARAINDIHKDILKLIGANQVILPEQEIGISLADNLSLPFTDLKRLTKEFSIVSLAAPRPFIGTAIEALNLYNKYHVYCIGIKQTDDSIKAIEPSHVVTAQDKLVFAGYNKELDKISKL